MISEIEILNKIDSLNVSKIKNVLSKISHTPKPVLSIFGPEGNDLKNIHLENYF